MEYGDCAVLDNSNIPLTASVGSSSDQVYKKCFMCLEPLKHLQIVLQGSNALPPEELLLSVAKAVQVSASIYSPIDLSSLPKLMLCSACQALLSDALKFVEEIQALQDRLGHLVSDIKHVFVRSNSTEDIGERSSLLEESEFHTVDLIRKILVQCWSPCRVEVPKCQLPEPNLETSSQEANSRFHTVFLPETVIKEEADFECETEFETFAEEEDPFMSEASSQSQDNLYDTRAPTAIKWEGEYSIENPSTVCNDELAPAGITENVVKPTSIIKSLLESSQSTVTIPGSLPTVTATTSKAGSKYKYRGPGQCNICGKVLQHRNHIARHIRMRHPQTFAELKRNGQSCASYITTPKPGVNISQTAFGAASSAGVLAMFNGTTSNLAVCLSNPIASSSEGFLMSRAHDNINGVYPTLAMRGNPAYLVKNKPQVPIQNNSQLEVPCGGAQQPQFETFTPIGKKRKSAVCRVCQTVFTSSSSAFRHVRTRHKEYSDDVTRAVRTLERIPSERLILSEMLTSSSSSGHQEQVYIQQNQMESTAIESNGISIENNLDSTTTNSFNNEQTVIKTEPGVELIDGYSPWVLGSTCMSYPNVLPNIM